MARILFNQPLWQPIIRLKKGYWKRAKPDRVQSESQLLNFMKEWMIRSFRAKRRIRTVLRRESHLYRQLYEICCKKSLEEDSLPLRRSIEIFYFEKKR